MAYACNAAAINQQVKKPTSTLVKEYDKPVLKNLMQKLSFLPELTSIYPVHIL